MTNPDDIDLPSRAERTLLGGLGSSPGERAYLDVFRCRRCDHDWEDHGTAGAVPPSKSKCQLAGCDCARFAQDGDV